MPKTGSADHRFKFGETITHLAVQKIAPAFDSVEVWGEGAASAKGADKAHWLSTDLSGVSAKASVAADGTVLPGDLVAITGLPDGHPAAALLRQGQVLHVRGVRHVLDRQRGALTRLTF